MADANTVKGGATSIFKLPVGMRYHELALTFANMTLADMKEIRLVANGKPIHRYSGVMRNVMNMFDGRGDAATSNILKIALDRYGLKNREAEEETAFNTGVNMPIRTLELHVDLATGLTDPSLILDANQSENSQNYTGKVIHCLPVPRATLGAGWAQFSDVITPGLTQQALNRVFISPDAGDITEGKIERDGRIIFERTKALNDSIQSDGVRVPQAGYYVIDRTERGYGGDPMPVLGVQDFRFRLNFTAAAQVNFQFEHVGVIGA